MGGGSSPAPPAVTERPPSATDTQSAEEEARLRSLLRSRRGARGLGYGARRRSSLLSTATPAEKAAAATGLLLESVLFQGDQGDGGRGPGDFGGSDAEGGTDSASGQGSDRGGGPGDGPGASGTGSDLG